MQASSSRCRRSRWRQRLLGGTQWQQQQHALRSLLAPALLSRLCLHALQQQAQQRLVLLLSQQHQLASHHPQRCDQQVGHLEGGGGSAAGSQQAARAIGLQDRRVKRNRRVVCTCRRSQHGA